MRIESKAVFENNEVGKAIFEAIEKDGRILMILAFATEGQAGLEEQPALFHPDQTALEKTSERGLDYLYHGPAIDLTEHLHLPERRRGFFRVD